MSVFLALVALMSSLNRPNSLQTNLMDGHSPYQLIVIKAELLPWVWRVRVFWMKHASLLVPLSQPSLVEVGVTVSPVAQDSQELTGADG